MSGMISFNPSSQPPSRPVVIDYPAALALRQMAALVDDRPKYLLAPEVSALLHFMPDLRRKMLFTAMWNTGARISEALALTRGDFLLRQQYPFVQLATFKQREDKAEQRAGRRAAGVVPLRQAPLSDLKFVTQLEMMIATLRIPIEHES